MIDIEQTFDKFDDEFLQFERIENPPCTRPDICGFLKLHELVPGTHDMVAAAEHDEIFLDVDPEKLAEVATEADLIYLHRCGIRWSSETDSLAMFV